MTGSPSYAAVNGEMIWAYPGPTTTGGSDWALMPGQRDRITAKAEAGNAVWYKLSAGCWVQAEAVPVSQTPIYNALSDGRYVPDALSGTDAITWAAADYPVTYAEYKNNALTVYFGGQNQIPALDVDISQNFDGTMLRSVAIGTANGTAYYTFAFKPGEEPDGYYTEYEPGIFRLCLKKRKELAAGPAPLTGFTFMLDPGHGGANLGARGPMGNTMAEKEINLLISQKLASKLRNLGAEVIMTRDSDVYSTTMERTEMSREAMPDMYISVHCNSMAEITDSTNIRGLTVWYRNESSVPLAEWFSESLYAVNPGTTRQNVLNQANFMVCRPAWTPSVLLECSFMNNIYDFSWLIKDSSQEALAAATASAIVGYYR
jgi:N-acetylmuramoyl-L-alanine amidase